MKKLKPIECDVHFKYLCPKCGSAHWLSLRESKTIDFKIVCYCEEVFLVATIDKIKIKYQNETLTKPQSTKSQINSTSTNDLFERASKTLMHYGFTKQESIELIQSSYKYKPNDDLSSLVKQTLERLRIDNASEHNTSI